MLSIEFMLYLDQELEDLTMDFTGDSANLFNNNMPDSPDEAVMVETGGGVQNMVMPWLKNPTIRILARGKENPVNVHKLAQAITNLAGNFHGDFFAPPEEVWDSSKTYSPKIVVENNTVPYVATQESKDVEPGIGEDWKDYWIELEGHFVTRCQRQNGPESIGRDEKNRIRYSANFELRTVVCNLIQG